MFLFGLLGTLVLTACVEPAQASAATSPALSNAVPVEVAPPKSLFVMPARPEEGRDPFFPKSIRPYLSTQTQVPTNSAAPATPQSIELKLSGISGTAAHPLAIINGKTFEKGEEGEVHVGPAKFQIRVIEIKANMVIVQMGAQQQVLRLRSGF